MSKLKMATNILLCLLLAFPTFFVKYSAASDSEPACAETCAKLYAVNVSSNHTLHSSCRRGCRFHSIMDLNRKTNRDATQKSCIVDCATAYSNTDQWRACRAGCEGHVKKKPQMLAPFEHDPEGTVEFLYPMLQVHRFYSDVFNHMWQHLHIQWSYFVQKDSGQVIVIKTQPLFVMAFSEMDSTNDKTPVNHETNLESVDLSATPNMKHSQVRSLDGLGGRYTQKDPQTYYSDWLNCLSNKTGMPHVIIVTIIVICLVIMVWLCFTATSSAPPKQQKLSINGDLQYMKAMGMESLMNYDRPHDRIHGNKLQPFKINILKA